MSFLLLLPTKPPSIFVTLSAKTSYSSVSVQKYCLTSQNQTVIKSKISHTIILTLLSLPKVLKFYELNVVKMPVHKYITAPQV